MRKQRRRHRSNSPGLALLKTCQTCSHAKIRCDRTQDSGPCDRCLRLDKVCIYAPARRQNQPRHTHHLRRRSPDDGQANAASTSASELQGNVTAPFVDDSEIRAVSAPRLSASTGCYDPLDLGWFDERHAKHLLETYRSRM